jgi:hypothetical protein
MRVIKKIKVLDEKAVRNKEINKHVWLVRNISGFPMQNRLEKFL